MFVLITTRQIFGDRGFGEWLQRDFVTKLLQLQIAR